jgi:peptidoglycan/LPS O-acetylase OafA/YrhL
MASIKQCPSSEIQHIESLDGIRGIAILMVLATHAGWFSGGWVGVDLFFVLSGFLITGILRKTRIEPFYWRRFYIKRATRILPPVLLGIVGTLLLWPNSSRIGIVGYALSLGNIVDMTRFSVYPIRHLWSLSVEEHYYLLWPLAVLKLPKKNLQWLLAGIVVTVAMGRLVCTYLVPSQEPYAIYLLTPFRIDGIALGSLLALLFEDPAWQERLKRWSGAGAALACGTYLCFWKLLGPGQFYPSAFSPIFNSIGYLLLALTAFFMIAYAVQSPEALATRILRNRLLTKVGRISYGLYVYSWILMVLVKQVLPSLSWRQAGLIHIAVSIPFAAILFKYYERPITVWGRRVAAKPPTRAGAAEYAATAETWRAHEMEAPEQTESFGT